MFKDKVLLDHGSGGLASQDLIRDIFLKHLDNPFLADLEDSAVIGEIGGRLVFTTDSYVVDPLFFPGGDIGSLSVYGTINDLAMRGASPVCLSLGFILEEGFALFDLERIVSSIARACEKAGVVVAAGDTKVVPRGKGDGIFINTSGLGFLAVDLNISASRARTGDQIILSGTLADHGITILTQRSGLELEGDFVSDSMPLHFLVRELGDFLGEGLHTLRDPTRGGLATSLCEIAGSSGVGITIEERALPVKPGVSSACEILGLDPLYIANEGKCLVLVEAGMADEALKIMRRRPEGRDAAIIGSVTGGSPDKVEMVTGIGGRRLITPLAGEPLPRIC
ncbi:MAG: hydrogenase expression/formation protein HypE [Thermodesulfobacteriota bacterium]